MGHRSPPGPNVAITRARRHICVIGVPPGMGGGSLFFNVVFIKKFASIFRIPNTSVINNAEPTKAALLRASCFLI